MFGVTGGVSCGGNGFSLTVVVIGSFKKGFHIGMVDGIMNGWVL